MFNSFSEIPIKEIHETRIKIYYLLTWENLRFFEREGNNFSIKYREEIGGEFKPVRVDFKLEKELDDESFLISESF